MWQPPSQPPLLLYLPQYRRGEMMLGVMRAGVVWVQLPSTAACLLTYSVALKIMNNRTPTMELVLFIVFLCAKIIIRVIM